MKDPHVQMADAVSSIVYGPEDGVYAFPLRAFCKNNKDPLGQGRIQVYIPSLNGESCPEEAALLWASPCFPMGGSPQTGVFSIPDLDSSIWVLFEAGSTSHPLYLGQWPASAEMPSETYSGGNPSYDFVYARKEMKLRSKRDGQELLIQFDSNTHQLFTPDRIEILRNDAKITMQDSLIELEVGSTKISMDGTNITLTSDGSHIKISPAFIDIMSAVVNLSKIVNVSSS